MDAGTEIEYLKLLSSQVHGVSIKPANSKKPVLEMTCNCIDIMLEWEAFIHKSYESYGDAASHLLDCLSKEL